MLLSSHHLAIYGCTCIKLKWSSLIHKWLFVFTVLVDKLPWIASLGLYHGPAIGHNIRVAKGSHLGSVLASLEEKVADANGEGTVRKRVNREYTYFRIRGNHEQTGTMWVFYPLFENNHDSVSTMKLPMQKSCHSSPVTYCPLLWGENSHYHSLIFNNSSLKSATIKRIIDLSFINHSRQLNWNFCQLKCLCIITNSFLCIIYSLRQDERILSLSPGINAAVRKS